MFWHINKFLYQSKYDESDINMQYFLFNAEDNNSMLNKNFKSKYGISVKQYLDFWRSLLIKNEDVNLESTAETILKCWTIEHQNVKTGIQQYSNGINNNFYKTFIPEFFLEYPIILFRGKHYCIDHNVLKRTVHEFLFSFALKSKEVKGNFDKRFQDYISKTLDELKIAYKNDGELKKEGELECDFLISEFLFAECKAVKLKPFAQVNPNDDTLKINLEKIIYAYKQIIATVNRFPNVTQSYFGVIITYLPFYFSDGTDIWEIIKSEIENFLNEKGYDLLVKPENLFFVDIKSWKQLINVLKKRGNNILIEIFLTAKLKNRTEPKFEFLMHLKDFM